MPTPQPLPELPPEGVRITIIGKGGSTKTHTFAHLLGHWNRMGVPASAIDSDEPGEDEDGSLYTWNQLAPFAPGIEVRAQYSPLRLPSEISSATPKGGICGIDTGAWANRPGGTHHSALAMSHLAVLCLQPHEGELNRSASVWAALQYLRDTGSTCPEVVVLFTRTHHNAKSTQQARETLTGSGIAVLDSTVPNEMGEDGYSRAFGKPLRLEDDDPMHLIAVEILERMALK
jgi:hypothetical protein